MHKSGKDPTHDGCLPCVLGKGKGTLVGKERFHRCPQLVAKQGKASRLSPIRAIQSGCFQQAGEVRFGQFTAWSSGVEATNAKHGAVVFCETLGGFLFVYMKKRCLVDINGFCLWKSESWETLQNLKLCSAEFRSSEILSKCSGLFSARHHQSFKKNH